MKHKIKHKLAAALVAAASLFCLTIPASAMSGDNGGGAGSGTSSQAYTPFSILKTNDTFAWRADLYVSTNADGRINEDNDIIGGKLALVGSVLCTSPTFANVTTYIQTNYTNEMCIRRPNCPHCTDKLPTLAAHCPRPLPGRPNFCRV